MGPDPTLCLVVPCYNEAERLKGERFVAWSQSSPQHHLLFVNDGSRDATAAHLENLAVAHPRIQAHHLPINQGKAEAVRQGFLRAAAEGHDLIGYWDADLATPFEEIPRYLSEFQGNPEIQAVFGSRMSRLGARIERKPLRHYLGRVAATAISLALGLPTYDTQCGAKIFRRNLIGEIFQERFISRWIFDVEILARLITQRGRPLVKRQICELPLQQWQDEKGSKLGWRDLVRAPGDLARLTWHYGLLSR